MHYFNLAPYIRFTSNAYQKKKGYLSLYILNIPIFGNIIIDGKDLGYKLDKTYTIIPSDNGVIVSFQNGKAIIFIVNLNPSKLYTLFYIG